MCYQVDRSSPKGTTRSAPSGGLPSGNCSSPLVHLGRGTECNSGMRHGLLYCEPAKCSARSQSKCGKIELMVASRMCQPKRWNLDLGMEAFGAQSLPILHLQERQRALAHPNLCNKSIRNLGNAIHVRYGTGRRVLPQLDWSNCSDFHNIPRQAISPGSHHSS